MTTKDLHPLLDSLPDTCEVVITRVGGGDGPVAVWRSAAHDARAAYGEWCTAPGPRAHASYLAAEDQADAALASLRALPAARALVTA